ncbi:ATP/GTP-binding protein [uncultured Cytophaga sp.]|uniref:SMP-30/gluconolactonase/LRE family protein n=1 Tax=uncultured Cytophaga sp. TaxID=160238 RepID=UPI0026310C45|nr:ATP/GTP-binding protein [uncultured Cytophaga sp.]
MNKIIYFVSVLLLLSCSENKKPEPEELLVTGVKAILKWQTDTIFKVPESVLYNKADEFLYVSNINGKPDSVDGNGFISRMSLDGKIEQLEWVKGLDAPKGMGVYNGKMYVTDIHKLVIIDMETATIEKSIVVDSAQFLNDVTIDAKGDVYFTDSDARTIHVYRNGVVSLWAKDPMLLKPNGLYALDSSLRIIDMETGLFYDADYTTKKLTGVAQGIPGGDGVMQVSKKEYIISCWPGEVYYINDTLVEKILDTKAAKLNAADACYVDTEQLLIVPTFFGNSVMAYTITK